MDLTHRAEFLCRNVFQSFNARTEVEGRKRGLEYGINLQIEIKNRSIWFTFTKGEESHSFNIPMPFIEGGVLLIEQNEVRRAVCPYLVRENDMVMDYFSIMQRLLMANPSDLIPANLVKRTPFIQRIIYGFENGNVATIMYILQRAISEITNRMPLHETPLNSWVMNRRLVIIDPEFDALRSPAERLKYQVEKSKEFFARGWTPIGLADNNLADKNYTLTYDIRHLTPFGMKYHNPQRNLYSTLGMKGDELPKIRSSSMQRLDQSVARKGWNLFTLFADIPDVFEDQIMVDLSHRDKFISKERRYQCFGMLHVKEGQKVTRGMTLSVSEVGMAKKFDLDVDFAKVSRISESITNVGGMPTRVFHVVIEYRRYLRDGMKFTNLHGNKGIIRMKNLGYAVDPRTGGMRKIDVIVSATSVKKRKNFGQIMEALLNNTTPEDKKPVVLDDYYEVDITTVKKVLAANGLPDDGVWHCETYVGPMEGVCGEVFWGVIASVESSLWDDGATIRRNTKDLRVAGLKFSHVEFRALTTRFGKNNPITKEILTYAQGGSDLREALRILKGKKGIFPDVPTYHAKDLKFVDQTGGTIVPENLIKGSIVDEYFEPDGYLVELPIWYQVMRNEKGEIVFEGVPLQVGAAAPNDVKESFVFNKIYVPKSNLRRCWQHDNGKLGLSEVGVLLNNILTIAHRLMGEPSNAVHMRLLYRSIATYFKRIANIMGSKTGEIAQIGMAVRYPFSSKAVATLSNSLPANTVEIHESMARQLRVKNGDVALVERFPCLGFMSIRPQKVRVTRDEMARFTIRASGNSLCSLGLDFDGDTLYLASLHTPEAKELLQKEWENPNPACWEIICKLNNKAGRPKVDNLSLDDYNISVFPALTAEAHAEIVQRATGVKSHTGPVIALAYNLMRILENSDVCDRQETNVAIEYFLDRVGNTVFKQKHGIKSLHDIVIDAICCGDVRTLAKEGFDEHTSSMIIEVVKAKALGLGVRSLPDYHRRAKQKGWSNIINRIVRTQNKIYFASRSSLEGLQLLDHLEAKAVDIPSKIFRLILSDEIGQAKTRLEECLEKEAAAKILDENKREACSELMKLVEAMLTPQPKPTITKTARDNMRKSIENVMGCRRFGICQQV